MQNRGNNQNDDVSLLGQDSTGGGSASRQVFQVSQTPALPPAPNNQAPQPPAPSDNSTRSTNAGSAFGR
jgi:hypothetical protein